MWGVCFSLGCRGPVLVLKDYPVPSHSRGSEEGCSCPPLSVGQWPLSAQPQRYGVQHPHQQKINVFNSGNFPRANERVNHPSRPCSPGLVVKEVGQPPGLSGGRAGSLRQQVDLETWSPGMPGIPSEPFFHGGPGGVCLTCGCYSRSSSLCGLCVWGCAHHGGMNMDMGVRGTRAGL